jgi:hypothetical protein
MRALGQPAVLKSAAVAALLTSLACYPRLVLLAPKPRYPVWYLESVLFLGGIVLWGFVFAWYTKYTNRPLLTWRVGWVQFALATLAGLTMTVLQHLLFDPVLRNRAPEDFPGTMQQWLALTLFNLAFGQLFLVFAPFAWLLRLFRSEQLAIACTVLFGAAVYVIRDHASPHPFPPSLLLGMVAVRLVSGWLALRFFLRGGVLLVWWWALLLQGRHFLTLDGGR